MSGLYLQNCLNWLERRRLITRNDDDEMEYLQELIEDELEQRTYCPKSKVWSFKVDPKA